MVALGRRAREGGSYHVELSLAQAGRYLTGLSRADAALAAREPDLPRERLDELMITRRSPYGALRYFAPVARCPARRPAGTCLRSRRITIGQTGERSMTIDNALALPGTARWQAFCGSGATTESTRLVGR
jgi:hypothetical protein